MKEGHRRRVSTFSHDERKEELSIVVGPPTPGFRPATPGPPQTASYLRTFTESELPPYEYPTSPSPYKLSDWRTIARGQLGKRVFAVACGFALLLLWWSHLKDTMGASKIEVDTEGVVDQAVMSVFGTELSNEELGAVCDEAQERPCKFLLAGVIKEQETKAQVHLHQLGLLAFALNRTLVLPQVSGSRFGECSKRPFSFYYNLDALSSLGVRTISHAEFVAWTEAQPHPPTSRVAAIAQGVEGGGGKVPEKQLSSKRLCLDKLRLEVEETPLVLYAPWRFHQWDQDRIDSVGAGLIKSLRPASAENASPDVLTVHFSLRHPILSTALIASLSLATATPLPFSHFPPAPIWTEVAESVLERLGPFVGIHWRLETLPTTHVPSCASSLLDQLVALKEEHPKLETVYLATDYPLSLLDGSSDPSNKPKANSDTFTKSLTPMHHDALQFFVDELGKRAPSLRLTSYAPELASITLPSPISTILDALPEEHRTLNDLDSGIPSLIDKLVVQQASIFLAGMATAEKGTPLADMACGKVSSYTEEIVEGRAKARGEGSEELWNEVEHFSTKGRWVKDGQ